MDGNGKSPRKISKSDKAAVSRAHKETMRIAIAKAHGVASNITCPDCGSKFDIKVGEKASSELLVHLLNIELGKPVTRAEIDMQANLELSSTQLMGMYTRLKEFQEQRKVEESFQIAEGEFKAIEAPKLPKEGEDVGQVE